MNKFLLPILAFILLACASPQVTVTSVVTVTSPPPTPTPIPTPTLHPQFIAMQDKVAASGERFTLLPDGTLEESTVDGATIVPGLTVNKNGAMTLQVGDETVILDPAKVKFDDAEGVSIEGYTFDKETGKWGAESPAAALFNEYGVDPGTYTLAEVDGVVVGTDNETGKEIFRDGRFEISYAAELAKKDCEPTDLEPKKSGGYVPEKDIDSFLRYMKPLFSSYIPSKDFYSLWPILIDREKQCWGYTDGDILSYRNETGLVRRIPTIHLTDDEISEFQDSR